MALPSTLNRKRGLFGASAPVPQQPAMTAVEQPLAPKQKFFGEGGVGRAIAGNIGDFLLQYSGMQPIYAPVMQQRQAAQQAEMQRQQGLADWVAKQEYEAANRPPPAPYRWEANDGSLMELGPDGQARVAFKDPTPRIQWMTVDNGDGTKSVIPYGPNGPLGDAPGAMPQRPKGKLTPYNGGQSAAPAGNFPR